MNGERAVLFATDPPYLVDYDGSNHDPQQGLEPVLRRDLGRQQPGRRALRRLHRRRHLEGDHRGPGTAGTPRAAKRCWKPAGEKAGAFVHQQIIWVKDRGVLTRSHYLWKHEPCFMGWRRPDV